MDNPELAQLIVQVEKKLGDLKARMPAHSVPAAMMMQMEELESELEQLSRVEKVTSVGLSVP